MKIPHSVSRDRVLIFDTTLRDGEQSPGATMTLKEKIEIAILLDEMGVDIIEAGFPIASEGDFRAVKEISRCTNNAIVCGLARSSPADIARAGDAVKEAKRPRIHTFISTSPLHMKFKLKMSPEDVIEAITRSVKQARALTDDIQWSPEDGTRTDHDFLCLAVETAISAGVTTINIPDTVGYTAPTESADIIGMLLNRVKGIERVTLSTHCHNDLGMAVANSLAAVAAGARQIECTINGLGERAGNAALEEVVMAINVRNDILPYSTGVDTKRIMQASRAVAAATGFPVQYNKAIVGKNAFSHESGIHQDGMIKHSGTYEIMRPEDVGLTSTNLVLGKHSGRAALRKKLEELGFEINDDMLNDVFGEFKKLCDKKKVIFDGDLIALMQSSTSDGDDEHLRVSGLRVICGSVSPQTAELDILVDGVGIHVESEGDGPVDAAFRAVDKVFPHKAKLLLYDVHAVTEGTDAQATVSVRLEEEGKIVVGQANDTDTILASTKAYVSALNNLGIRRSKTAAAQISEAG